MNLFDQNSLFSESKSPQLDTVFGLFFFESDSPKLETVHQN